MVTDYAGRTTYGGLSVCRRIVESTMILSVRWFALFFSPLKVVASSESVHSDSVLQPYHSWSARWKRKPRSDIHLDPIVVVQHILNKRNRWPWLQPGWTPTRLMACLVYRVHYILIGCSVSVSFRIGAAQRRDLDSRLRFPNRREAGVVMRAGKKSTKSVPELDSLFLMPLFK